MTNDDPFAGTASLEERVPLATDEELRALISFFDTDSLRTQYTTLLSAVRKELRRRGA